MQTWRATAVSCPTIAFSKYWGNRDDGLRLPTNGSIAMNLEELATRTTVEFDPQHGEDAFTLQGAHQAGAASRRVSDQLNLIRNRAGVAPKDIYFDDVLVKCHNYSGQ